MWWSASIRLGSLLARYWAPVLIATAFVALGVAFAWAYSQGRQHERAVQASVQAAAEQRARQRQEVLADELEAARLDRRVVYRDRVRVVERSADPTGCADVAAPHGVLDSLGYRATGQ
jgi:hypothetical protein